MLEQDFLQNYLKMGEERTDAKLRHLDLACAAYMLYQAGHWECDRLSDDEQARLWENLRDAIGLEPGNAPELIKNENAYKGNPEDIHSHLLMVESLLRYEAIDKETTVKTCKRLGTPL